MTTKTNTAELHAVLEMCAKNGYLDTMKSLITDDIDMDKFIVIAMREGHNNIVEWYADNGHVYAGDAVDTMLEIAVNNMDLPMVRILLNHEADPDCKDLLFIAITNLHDVRYDKGKLVDAIHIVNLLVKHGAKIYRVPDSYDVWT